MKRKTVVIITPLLIVVINRLDFKHVNYGYISRRLLSDESPETANTLRLEDMSDVSKVYDCFLCFHDCDAEKAIAILEYCEKKENGGYKFFHIDRDCTGGPFSDVFRLALDQSKTIMILVSQQALTERWFDVLMNESLIVYIEEKVQIITVFIEDDYYDGLPEMLHSFYKLKYYTPFFWYQLKEMLRNQLNPSNS